MRPVILIPALALIATIVTAAAARAQDGGNAAPPPEMEWSELGGMELGMHEGWGEPGFGRRHGMGRHGMRGRGPGFGLGPEAIKELNLTDAQRQQLADIRERHQKAAITNQADLRLAALDLGKLMRAEKPDVQAIERQIDRISELRATQMKSRLTGVIEARSVLTPAQQKKLREMRSERRSGSGQGRNAPRGT